MGKTAEQIAEFDTTDPELGLALAARASGWQDEGVPADYLWELPAATPDRYHRDCLRCVPSPLTIVAMGDSAGPKWAVHYPAPDQSYREPDEVYRSRHTLLIALDRLEKFAILK